MVTRYKKDLTKDVLTVIGGGLLEVAVESMMDAWAPQVIMPGAQPYNVGDAVGGLEALFLATVGIANDNKRVFQLGAGGLAVAVPNLTMKVIANSMTPATTAGSFSMASGGTYNRVKSAGTMNVTAMRYPRR